MNYYKHIMEGCREFANILNYPKAARVEMFGLFIKLMGEKQFNTDFEYYFMSDEYKTFDGGFHDFHKSMRQTDFYDMGENSGAVDSLFWYFIHSSETTYFLLKRFTERIKIGVVVELDNDLDGNLGWDNFGFFGALHGVK